MKKIIFIVLITLLIIIFCPVSVFAQSSITINLPSRSESVIPEAKDFATLKFSDPWDMKNREDAGLFYENFRNVSMRGGIWKGTTNNRSSHFWVQWGGYPGSYPNGREGIINKINANYFKRFSVKMYSSRRGNGRLWWFWTQNLRKRSWTLVSIKSGWNIYQIDLPSSWRGYVIGLRFDPITKRNTRVAIDWIRLTPVSRNLSAKITWENTGREGNSTIFLDNNSSGYNGVPISTVYSNKGKNSYKLNTSGLAPGKYYVYIGKNGKYSSYSRGPILINQSPIFKIISPDKGGGTDWATRYLHNSWNMSQYSDVEKYGNIKRRRISHGVLSGVNYRPKKNDPYIWLRLARKLINTNRYRYLTFKYRYSGKFNLHRGTMSRFVWRTRGHGWNISDDIVTYGGGWRTYKIDLKKIRLNGGRYGWRGYTDIFRFDPHEDRYSRYFNIDYIKLSVEDRLSSSFAIKFKNSDNFGGGRGNILKLYWDADKRFGNGNEHLIVSKRIGNGSSYYRWKPRRSFRKRVWIYAQVSDGINTNGYYSTGMLRVHM